MKADISTLLKPDILILRRHPFLSAWPHARRLLQWEFHGEPFLSMEWIARAAQRPPAGLRCFCAPTSPGEDGL